VTRRGREERLFFCSQMTGQLNTAVNRALKAAQLTASPRLMEPICSVEITVPVDAQFDMAKNLLKGHCIFYFLYI